MSSTYAVLCLSHDPAVVAADGGWQQPEAAERAIEAGIEGHEQCDLLLGRYSASLIELGCPNSYAERRKGQHRCLMHTRTKWVDLGWLRLLALAQEQPEGSALRKAAADHVGNCWPVLRLSRLRAELSLGERSEPEPVKVERVPDEQCSTCLHPKQLHHATTYRSPCMVTYNVGADICDCMAWASATGEQHRG